MTTKQNFDQSDVRSQARPFCGEIRVPGDKSLSHRAVMFAAIAEGSSRISGLLDSLDVQSTIAAVKQLGAIVALDLRDGAWSGTICGWGKSGPSVFEDSADNQPIVLDCGNSGTTARLMMGIVAGWPMNVMFTGDASLSKRPMGRVATPLAQMGCGFTSQRAVDWAVLPLLVSGTNKLQAITYECPVASAQVKSAIMLAALQADGVTEVIEPIKTRDHTELCFSRFGLKAQLSGCSIKVPGRQIAKASDIQIPGDPSSAAFILVAAALAEGSSVTVKNVLLNPLRTGFITVMQRMGAALRVKVNGDVTAGEELRGDISLDYTDELSAAEVTAAEVPALIDEIPILALLACAAKGTTVFRSVGELRVKESNRLAAIVSGLSQLGFRAYVQGDDLMVCGKTSGWANRGSLGHVCSGSFAAPESHGDHRLAMTWAVAGTALGFDLRQSEADRQAVAVSYPSFYADMASLQQYH